MNVLDGAYVVLKSAGHPLHYREITELMLARRLWRTEGKTPVHTVGASLAVDVKKLGAGSRFVRTAKGVFGLREWTWTMLPPTAEPAEGADAPAESEERVVAPVPNPPPLVAPTPISAPTLSFPDAAERVLEHTADRQPLHYTALTQRALAAGWLCDHGVALDRLLYAAICADIERQQARAERPRFTLCGQGRVGLSYWQQEAFAQSLDQHNEQVRQAVQQSLLTLAPETFAERIGQLLVAMGFSELVLTPRWTEGGFDAQGALLAAGAIRLRVALQVRRWRHQVQAPDLQRMRADLGTAEKGLFITTSDFSVGAQQEAARLDGPSVGLIAGGELAGLLVAHGLGVRKQTQVLLEMAEGGD